MRFTFIYFWDQWNFKPLWIAIKTSPTWHIAPSSCAPSFRSSLFFLRYLANYFVVLLYIFWYRMNAAPASLHFFFIRHKRASDEWEKYFVVASFRAVLLINLLFCFWGERSRIKVMFFSRYPFSYFRKNWIRVLQMTLIFHFTINKDFLNLMHCN